MEAKGHLVSKSKTISTNEIKSRKPGGYAPEMRQAVEIPGGPGHEPVSGLAALLVQ